MIIDKLSNAHLYYSMGPLFEKAFRYLQETNLAAMEPGKYLIDGENLFIMIKHYDSLPLAECKLENHHHYADIQMVISGKEYFCYAPVDKLTLKESRPDKDAYYFDGHCDPITLTGDLFALVLPDDAHMPERAINEVREPIVKAIVKVKIK